MYQYKIAFCSSLGIESPLVIIDYKALVILKQAFLVGRKKEESLSGSVVPYGFSELLGLFNTNAHLERAGAIGAGAHGAALRRCFYCQLTGFSAI
jgi:hypothetical protein